MFQQMFKIMLSVALSLRTASWLLAAQVVLFLAGAFHMPAMKAYSSMNSMPLLVWMLRAPPSATWWLWASVAVMALLVLNTICCSVDSIIRKQKGRHWLLVASPQIIHLGFMLMLLAHLLSASGGFKARVMAGQGQSFNLPDGQGMKVMKVLMELSPRGMPLNYYADARFYDRNGQLVGEHRIAPNKPAFFSGMGFYVKEVRGNTALLEVTRDPGTLPALAGGALFSLGTVVLVGLKIRRER